MADVVTGAEVESIFDVVRNPFGMLDDLPIHVGHPERSVRAGLDRRGAAPIIGGGEEFGLLLIGRPPAGKCRAVGRHDLAVD